MNKTVMVAAMSVVMAVQVGCSTKDANYGNVKSAVNRYLEQGNQDFCLGLKKWPRVVSGVEMQMINQFPDGLAGKMAYLEKAGLVSGKVVQEPVIGFFGGNSTEYQLTTAGQKYIQHNKDSHQTAGDLCFANLKLVKLTNWYQDTNGMEANIVATYTYEAKNIAPWATSPAFKEIFAFAANRAFSPTPANLTLHLDDDHWQVVEPVIVEVQE